MTQDPSRETSKGSKSGSSRMTWRARLALTCTTAMLLLAPNQAASAYTEDQLAWGGCSWSNWPYAVEVKAEGYPANSYASDSGGTNSFTARISDAVSQWNAHTSSISNYTYNIAYQPSTSNPEILFRNVNPGAGDADTIGYAYVQKRGGFLTSDFYGVCPRKSGGDAELQFSRIDTKVLDTWFTQGPQQRSYWENCTNRSVAYSTCSKENDFGQLATHELGHAIGQSHPETTAERSSTAASCTNNPYRATMCNINYRFRTEGRTVESWDVESYRRHSYNYYSH